MDIFIFKVELGEGMILPILPPEEAEAQRG